MGTPSDARYTVLIVDDNPWLLQILSTSLAELDNLTIVTARDGAEGLEQFYETRPDCAVIDVKMPELDGFQLVRALRGDPETAQTPIIILTALVQDSARFVGLASGADQFLVKPVKPTELIAAIHRAMELRDEDRKRRLFQLSEDQPAGES
jgi:CheY-like chemotaxis protein